MRREPCGPCGGSGETPSKALSNGVTSSLDGGIGQCDYCNGTGQKISKTESVVKDKIRIYRRKLNDALELKTTTTRRNKMIGKKVIVRANTAGVHAGIVESIDLISKAVVLTGACRLWRVYTRDKSGSISDVAAHGLKEPLSQHSIGAELKSVMIVNDAGLEIAEMTDDAYASILSASSKP